MATKNKYPATLEIDYQKKLDRVTTFFRFLWAIPILILIGVLTGGGNEVIVNEAGKEITHSSAGIAGGLTAATALMIVFRQRYPRWWFDFVLELNRFTTRVGAYLFLLTDKYPSTVEKQSVDLNLKYPDVKKDLSQWLPLFKWLLALPHYIILFVLAVGAVFATVIAWFSILFTGSYPRGLFDYVVGVGRWSLRVNAYAFLLVTDEYPPFSLK
jgi:hypothetical protein